MAAAFPRLQDPQTDLTLSSGVAYRQEGWGNGEALSAGCRQRTHSCAAVTGTYIAALLPGQQVAVHTGNVSRVSFPEPLPWEAAWQATPWDCRTECGRLCPVPPLPDGSCCACGPSLQGRALLMTPPSPLLCTGAQRVWHHIAIPESALSLRTSLQAARVFASPHQGPRLFGAARADTSWWA